MPPRSYLKRLGERVPTALPARRRSPAPRLIYGTLENMSLAFSFGYVHLLTVKSFQGHGQYAVLTYRIV